MPLILRTDCSDRLSFEKFGIIWISIYEKFCKNPYFRTQRIQKPEYEQSKLPKIFQSNHRKSSSQITESKNKFVSLQRIYIIERHNVQKEDS